MTTEKATLSVHGMSCGGCAVSLQQALLALEGVSDAVVSFDRSEVVIEFTPAQVGREALDAAIVAAGYETSSELDGTSDTAEARETLRFSVTGMTCGGCSAGLQAKLSELEGVNEATVNYALSNAEVNFEPSDVTPLALQQAVQAAGYNVSLNTTRLQLGGMSCAGCVAALEKVLMKATGVVSVEVNLALETATVSSLGEADVAQLLQRVAAAGYQATVFDDSAEPTIKENAQPLWQQQGFQLLVAIGLSLPMVLQMLLGWLDVDAFLPHWLEWLLATPVQFWIGARFYQGAVRSLKAGSGNMDVLVALGTSAAYFFSVYLWLGGHQGHLYFESSAVVITLVLLGKWLESRAKKSASKAIRSLVSLRPSTVTLVLDSAEKVVAVASAQVGDLMLVKPGERLALDGLVEHGSSDLDESMLTGESLPVLRGVGDFVTGGSINGTGALRVRIAAVGADTTLAKVIEIVEKAQAGKAPIQRLVDKISAIFVPVVLVIALLTFAGWLLVGGGFEQALIAAVTVLVIACPCALGLATPTALVAGTGVAAKHGILIKDIETLERAHSIDRVVFDKTGTLTLGKPVVTQFVAEDEQQALRLAASLQSHSEHPLAQALLSVAVERGIELAPVDDFQAVAGSGVQGSVEGVVVAIGNLEFAASHGANVEPWQDQIAEWESLGQTSVLVVCNAVVIAAVAFADQLRESSQQAVLSLEKSGISVALLSGDATAVTENVANTLGISTWQAALKPADKSSVINAYRERGEFVAMVGDGINDAPALAASDVGIAMGSGTDVAIETAAITLMRSDPALVPAALDIAKATRRKIHQNLFWAFIYNLLGLPLAAFGLLTPTMAGAAMALSSVSVVSNALLLRRWRMKK